MTCTTGGIFNQIMHLRQAPLVGVGWLPGLCKKSPARLRFLLARTAAMYSMARRASARHHHTKNPQDKRNAR
jgi:hypothetical protein